MFHVYLLFNVSTTGCHTASTLLPYFWTQQRIFSWDKVPSVEKLQPAAAAAAYTGYCQRYLQTSLL